MDELFSIGYSPHILDTFLDTLKKYHITAVADVRSSPYGQFKPEFNKEQLFDFLQKKVSPMYLSVTCVVQELRNLHAVLTEKLTTHL
ncbi:MAG: DUF488 family protein [Candidatus Electrothrix sp. MAN1_4]|nr:DUF488 family protein [Candidatus Electrothrix sp. MAN1_4]